MSRESLPYAIDSEEMIRRINALRGDESSEQLRNLLLEARKWIEALKDALVESQSDCDRLRDDLRRSRNDTL